MLLSQVALVGNPAAHGGMTLLFFNAGHFVDIIDCLSEVWEMWIVGEQFNVVEHSHGQ